MSKWLHPAMVGLFFSLLLIGFLALPGRAERDRDRLLQAFDRARGWPGYAITLETTVDGIPLHRISGRHRPEERRILYQSNTGLISGGLSAYTVWFETDQVLVHETSSDRWFRVSEDHPVQHEMVLFRDPIRMLSPLLLTAHTVTRSGKEGLFDFVPDWERIGELPLTGITNVLDGTARVTLDPEGNLQEIRYTAEVMGHEGNYRERYQLLLIVTKEQSGGLPSLPAEASMATELP